MAETKKKASSHWWWFESHNSSATVPKRSPWLQSTLAELDEKTKAMLRVIEEDADSFAKRAEMYYKKRPELISMIEEFYRAHRSLAERYDLFKSEAGPRLTTPWASPVPFKYSHGKSISCTEKSYDSFSENYDHMDSGESEVDDPDLEEEEEEEVEDQSHEMEVSSKIVNEELANLKEEIERLKEENNLQKKQLEEKDEEKREVIRQLTVAMDLLKEENVKLKKYIAKETPKKSVKSPSSPSEFQKLKGIFMGKLFSGSPNSKASLIAL